MKKTKRMSAKSDLRIAIIGAGLGGCAVGSLLQKAGYRPTVYEQTSAVTPLGAGIHLSPNVTRVLDRIGVCEKLATTGMRPRSFVSRDWDTGAVTLDFALRDVAEARYGAPYLTVHRGDLQMELFGALMPGSVQFGKPLSDIDATGACLKLAFADGTTAEADVVIGADGVHSRVREILLGPEAPAYTGHVAHRSIMSMERFDGHVFEDTTKWWHPDLHIVVYYVTGDRSHIYFVTGVPEPEWRHEAWAIPGDPDEVRAAFEGFHDDVQILLGGCTEVMNWAILERKPFELWSEGRIVMLGDACHPMRPHMGQGAAMAIEDAAMLVRCIKPHPTDLDYAFRLYAANRQTRTGKVQHYSHHNDWLQYTESSDPDWVFDYDVFTELLVSPKGLGTGTAQARCETPARALSFRDVPQ